MCINIYTYMHPNTALSKTCENSRGEIKGFKIAVSVAPMPKGFRDIDR